ncbi:MAG: N-formylglutamate amidohydrolase [Hyphococcus sp.]
MKDYSISTSVTFGEAPYFVFCDHASNAMPDTLKCLGMPEDMLNTHIAWDIGAGPLSEAVAKKLGATLFRCEYSRLIIDPNRSLDAPDLIPAVSDKIPVPGNQNLDETEVQSRIATFHVPYHEQLAAALDQAVAQHARPFIVSIHSFTHRLMEASEDRPWEIGLLWSEDEASARAMISHLDQNTDWLIGDNEPYDAREFNYSIDRHVGPRNLGHLTIELRQDVIGDERSVDDVSTILSEGIAAVAEKVQ